MGELHKGPPPLPGGTYSFDEDTLRSLIKDWDDLIDSYTQSLWHAEPMADVVGPGADPASISFAEVASKSGSSYLKSVAQNLRYCTEQRTLFQKALDQYLGIEDSAAAGFNQTMPDGSLPEV